jgi:hypothetical protein
VALEERLPDLLVVPPDELDARQLSVADVRDEQPLVVAFDLAAVRARLHVVHDGGGR